MPIPPPEVATQQRTKVLPIALFTITALGSAGAIAAALFTTRIQSTVGMYSCSTPTLTEAEETALPYAGNLTQSLADAQRNLRTALQQANNGTLRNAAQSRLNLFAQAMQTDPSLALQYVLTATERTQLASRVTGCAEQPTSTEGAIVTSVEEDFQEGSAPTYRSYLQRADASLQRIYTSADTTSIPEGSTIRVQGFAVGKSLLFGAVQSSGVEQNEASTFAVLQPPPKTSVTGQRKVLVLLESYPNAPFPAAWTVSAVQQEMQQVGAYYDEASYTLLTLGAAKDTEQRADVRGVYQSPYDLGSDHCAFPDPYYTRLEWLDDAGVDFSQYSYLITFGNYAAVGCNYAGMAYLGQVNLDTPDGSFRYGLSRINTGNSTTPERSHSAIAHELGHNFGLHHANFVNCTDVNQQLEDCPHGEYYDRYSMMGLPYTSNVTNEQTLPHHNTLHKKMLGWILPNSLSGYGQYVVANEAGTYEIGPLETNSALPEMLVVPSGSLDLYVEYRRPVGFDADLRSGIFGGAVIHIKGNINGASALVDVIPPIAFHTDIPLRLGKTYKRITVTGTSATSLTVRVDGMAADEQRTDM